MLVVLAISFSVIYVQKLLNDIIIVRVCVCLSLNCTSAKSITGVETP